MHRPSKELCACGKQKSQVAKICWECRKKRLTRNCVICGKEFEYKRSTDKKTCSRSCAYKLRGIGTSNALSKKIPIICKLCGKTILVSPAYSNKKFCSSTCAYKYNSGENNAQWKGGITSQHDAFYNSKEWKQKCREVWERDSATCRRCGSVHKNKSPLYHVHHIKRWARFPEDRMNIDNLVLLCNPCHRFVHSKKNKSYEFIFHKGDDD